MKKPSRRKTRTTKPRPQQLTTATSHTTATLPAKAGRPDTHNRTRAKRDFSSAWKRFWPVVGGLTTALNIGIYFWPSLTLTDGASLDPRQDFATSFVATNTGNIPIYKINFVCQLVGNHAVIGELEAGEEVYSEVPVLKKGQPATRSCFTKSLKVDGPMLRVTAYYHWPLIGTIANTVAYFVPRKGEAGTVLVLEPEPSAPPGVLVTVGVPPT